MSFNPFGKKLSEVIVSDLAVLKDVSEGWSVEYKRQGIKIKDIAKQISAFANQHGGYLFFGIEESQDSNKKAEAFPGIDISDAEKLSTSIREATTTHVSPEVYYDEKILIGPCDDIGLVKGKAIIVIDIPVSFNPPHIHSSGKIYMRHADQSTPKALTDRYEYDRLVDRQRDSRDQISEFFNNIPELPIQQKNAPFVYVFLTPNPYVPLSDKDLSFEQFCSCVKEFPEGFGDTVPMQMVHPVKGGFYAKQTEGNDPAHSTSAIRYWHDRTVRFDIPIRYGTLKDLFDPSNGNKYRHTAPFVEEYYNQGFNDIIICDYSHVTLMMMSMCNMYLHMVEALGDKAPFLCTFTIKNVFNTVPYLDTEKYAEHCSAYGIPVTNDNIIKHKEKPYFDNMLKIDNWHSYGDKIDPLCRHYPMAEIIGLFIRQHLGLLIDVHDHDIMKDGCFHMSSNYKEPTDPA